MISLKSIAEKNGLDFLEFYGFLRKTHPEYIKTEGFLSPIEVIPDEYVDSVVDEFRKKNQELKERAEKEQHKARLMSEVLISSGFNFDGYKIVKYSGYISGDDTVQISRSDVCNNNSAAICDALVKIRAQALKELKEAALALDCNAVIGVDFDYMTFEPETANFSGGTTYYPYMICVTANGNAVVIEKE